MRTKHQPRVVAGRYALQTRLPDASTGLSWLANDLVLDRRVAIELIHPDLADDPAVAARLDEVARSLARASGRVLVALLDAGVEDGVPYLVTEHTPGVTFAELLRDEGPFEPGRAASGVAQVLVGVEEAHTVGVLHLDLRPANVVRTPEGELRLRGAGPADAVVRTRGNEAVHLVGARLAPGAGERPDPRADVWSAGALLFELLTGRPPSADLRSPRQLRRDVPRAIDAAVARALADEPDERFADAASMAAALAAATRVRARVSPADQGRAHRGWFRTWFAVPTVVAAVAAAVVVGGLWLGRLELGGPVGIRLNEEPPGGAPRAMETIAASSVSVSVVDPFGDGHENDDNLALASDGDRATVWRSENYFDGRLNKPGIGVLLDLGDRYTVEGLRLWTPSPGFEFRVFVGDDPATLVQSEATPGVVAESDTRLMLDGDQGRYVLVWITSVVPTADGHRAEIAEIRVLGGA